MKRLFLTLTFVLFFSHPLLASGWKEIAPNRVYDLLKEGSSLWLIDVRGPSSFEEVHIEGSVNIPAQVLVTKRFPERKILVIVDNSPGQVRAREEADNLAKIGQKRVFVLIGGVYGWMSAGLPLVGESNWELARLNPGDLRKAGTSLTVYDLREKEERSLGEISGSSIVKGNSLQEKMAWVRNDLDKKQGKGPLASIKTRQPVVVVIPKRESGEAVFQKFLWNMPGEVRVLEGQYAVWDVASDMLSISNIEGCPTCPGSKLATEPKKGQ